MSNFNEFADKADIIWGETRNDRILIDTFMLNIKLNLPKINGCSREVINRCEDWPQLKRLLAQQYGKQSSYYMIEAKVASVKQGKEESMSEYINKVRGLAEEWRGIYGENIQPIITDKIDGDIKRALIDGIANNTVRERVRPNLSFGLEELCKSALALQTDFDKNKPNRDLMCLYCNIRGHRESECRKKTEDRERNSTRNNMICMGCGSNRHLLAACPLSSNGESAKTK